MYGYSTWYELNNSQGKYVIYANHGIPDIYQNVENIGLYGFYPNTFATKMIVERYARGVGEVKGPVYMEVEMKQHEFLNGSFYVLPFWDHDCNWDDTSAFWERRKKVRILHGQTMSTVKRTKYTHLQSICHSISL